MKILRKSWATVLLCIGGAALAQPETSAEPKDVAPPTATADVKLSAQTMREMKLGYEEAVRADIRHVIALRERTRQAKDLIKLTCVNDKYVQIKALANVFDTQRAVLEGAISNNAEERHELFRDVSKAGDDIHKLRGEADACVGEPELTSDSLNDYTAPQFPDDPLKGDPYVPGGGIEPPGYASPFQ